MRFWGQFSGTALVIDTFYVKYCSVLLENLPQNRDNFQKLTFLKLFLDTFLYNFMGPKRIQIQKALLQLIDRETHRHKIHRNFSNFYTRVGVLFYTI